MKLTTILFSAAALAAVLVLTAASMQDKKPADPKATGGKPVPAGADTPGMPAVKPGPEHAQLAKDAGTWDATVTNYWTGKPEVSKATETRKMIGGLWLVSDFVGEMNHAPFFGHGVNGYDPEKKKYVGTWVDTMSPALNVTEGTYDEATKTSTCKMKMVHMGQEVVATITTEHKDADTQIFKMMMPGPEGKEIVSMTIEYKRKK